MPDLIKVLIADDHQLVRDGVRAALDSADDITIVGEAPNGKVALELVESLQPDLLVVDIEMPVMTGVEVARTLSENKSPVYVLALSAFDDREYVYGMLDSGASGYLMKAEADSETLVDAIRSIIRTEGEFWISPNFAEKLVRIHLDERRAKVNFDSLTSREQEILRLVAQGKDNTEVGEELFISSHTVKNHIEHVKAKIGVRSRAELIAWAWRNKYVTPEEA